DADRAALGGGFHSGQVRRGGGGGAPPPPGAPRRRVCGGAGRDSLPPSEMKWNGAPGPLLAGWG
ncbi:hypothetical protein, partial [Flavonifractor plautii]|uniref:hypothetical protein n=1 Tax=Flavonifractor plautii TaxID=292800 RepID=UPI001EDF9905